MQEQLSQQLLRLGKIQIGIPNHQSPFDASCKLCLRKIGAPRHTFDDFWEDFRSFFRRSAPALHAHKSVENVLSHFKFIEKLNVHHEGIELRIRDLNGLKSVHTIRNLACFHKKATLGVEIICTRVFDFQRNFLKRPEGVFGGSLPAQTAWETSEIPCSSLSNSVATAFETVRHWSVLN